MPKRNRRAAKGRGRAVLHRPVEVLHAEPVVESAEPEALHAEGTDLVEPSPEILTREGTSGEASSGTYTSWFARMRGLGGLVCPVCECKDTRVSMTLPLPNSIRRYRQCRNCGHTWPTLES